MDVLLTLCQKKNSVVSAEELLLACWGNVPHGDNPLHKTITQLRHALGDSTIASRYIETIRKRGYRAIAEIIYDDEVAAGSWVQGSPFRGLEAFEEKHASVFFGRKQAIQMLLHTVHIQVAASCAMILVLGPSGSGKTSLIRAGLLPQLMTEQSTVDAGISITCNLYFDCADLGTNDIFQALGSALLDSEVDGGLVFAQESAASLGQALARDIDVVIAKLQQKMQCIKICLLIDRLEIIFRSTRLSETICNHFYQVLDQLARSGCMLIILACRNDFYPYLIAYPTLMALKLRGGHFDVHPPGSMEMAQIIRQPARAAELRFETDEITGVSLDDVLCDAATTSPDILPLLQYCLEELYRLRTEANTLSLTVFKQLGGIEGAIGARAEQCISTMSAAQLAALPCVLSQLLHIAEDEMAVTSHRAAWEGLHTEAERELVKALVEARLFVSDLSGDTPSFGVAHDALLRRWVRVVEWIEQHRAALQLHSRVNIQAERWQHSGRARDLLLPRGAQVNQARSLLGMPEFSLSPHEQDFIRASLQQVRLATRVRYLILGLVLVLALTAIALGSVARVEQRKSQQHRIEAEGLMEYMLGDFSNKLRPLGRLDLLDGVSSRALHYLSASAEPDLDPVSLTQRAKALQVIAEVKIARADPKAAEQALLTAQQILHARLAQNAGDKTVLMNLGANAFWLGQIHLNQNAWGQAQRYFSAYLSYSDKLATLDPEDVEAWIEQSYAHNNLGTVALKRGALDTAALEFSMSLDLKKRAMARRPDDKNLAADLADSYSWLASTKEKSGELKAAMTLYEREFQLILPIHEAAQNDALWTHRLAFAYWHQAELTQALGNKAAALNSFLQAETLLQDITKQDPSNLDWQIAWRMVQIHLLDGGKPSKAPEQTLSALRTIDTQLTALSRKEPKKINLQNSIATTVQSEAAIHLALGHLEDARQCLQLSIVRLEQLHAVAPSDLNVVESLAHSWLLLAEIQTTQDEQESAHFICRKVQNLLRAVSPVSSDFHLLDPWVRSHYCTHEAETVSAQQQSLAQMNYRDDAYLRYLSNHSIKKGKK